SWARGSATRSIRACGRTPRGLSAARGSGILRVRIAPKWRNWQTRTFEGRVGQPVGVRVPPSAPPFFSEIRRRVADALRRPSVMPRSVLRAGLCGALVLVPAAARADATYEMTLRTSDVLVGGAVELEEQIVVSVKGDRLRQEATGSRAVVTRRGARYTKPGKSLTLDQLDRGRRFEIDPDTGTYVEQAFADIRRRREAELSGAEKA